MQISCEQSALVFLSAVICCGSSVNIYRCCFHRNPEQNHNTKNDTNDLKDHYDSSSDTDTDSDCDLYENRNK